MEWINEYNLYPGVYEHYKGELYVVENIITHSLDSKNEFYQLDDPKVVYRNLVPIYRPKETGTNKETGEPITIMVKVTMVFEQPLSRFFENIKKGVKRFKMA
jgi:hypothetical protein